MDEHGKSGTMQNDNSSQPLPEGLTTEFTHAVIKFINNIVQPNKQPLQSDPFTNESTLPGAGSRHAPTLHDVHRKNPGSWWLSVDVENEDKFQQFFMYLRNFQFLKELRHSSSLHKDLPEVPEDQQGDYHSVWILCSTKGTAWESITHWTVMTQGHLFELTASKDKPYNQARQTGLLRRKMSHNDSTSNLLKYLLHFFGQSKSPDHSKSPPRTSGSSTSCDLEVGDEEQHKTPIRLKHRDFSRRSTKDSKYEMAKEKKSKRKKLVAYHVGHTRYTPQDVHKLSDRIMDYMRTVGIGSYDQLRNNCQHFVVSLVRRIVMTQREPRAVAGTRLEVVEWDRGEPGYYLKKWLTKWKARAFTLPTEYTDKFPKRLIPLAAWLPIFVHDDRTFGKYLQTLFHDRSKLGDAMKGFLMEKHKLKQLKDLFRSQFKNHIKWRKYDGYGMLGWWATIVLIASVLEVLASIAMANGAPAVAFMIPVIGSELFAGGLLAYIFITRVIYARGSLTIVHWDIKRSPREQEHRTNTINNSDRIASENEMEEGVEILRYVGILEPKNCDYDDENDDLGLPVLEIMDSSAIGLKVPPELPPRPRSIPPCLGIIDMPPPLSPPPPYTDPPLLPGPPPLPQSPGPPPLPPRTVSTKVLPAPQDFRPPLPPRAAPSKSLLNRSE